MIRKTRRSPQSSFTRSLANQYSMDETPVNKILKEKNFEFGPPKKTKNLPQDEKIKELSFVKIC